MVTAERGLMQHSKTKAEKSRTRTSQVELVAWIILLFNMLLFKETYNKNYTIDFKFMSCYVKQRCINTDINLQFIFII